MFSREYSTFCGELLDRKEGSLSWRPLKSLGGYSAKNEVTCHLPPPPPPPGIQCFQLSCSIFLYRELKLGWKLVYQILANILFLPLKNKHQKKWEFFSPIEIDRNPCEKNKNKVLLQIWLQLSILATHNQQTCTQNLNIISHTAPVLQEKKHHKYNIKEGLSWKHCCVTKLNWYTSISLCTCVVWCIYRAFKCPYSPVYTTLLI
jgi:hypothetical protein